MAIPSSKLLYLYETFRTGSMRGAGEHLGVAVSSISRQIAQLESELGIPLIEHGRRSVKLTEAGKLAIDYYRNTAEQHSTFVEQLRDLKGARTGSIDLAIGEGFIMPAFSEMLALFNARFPAIAIAVHVRETNRISTMVQEDEAHIGLAFEGHDNDRLQKRVTAPQPIHCVMSARHRLATRSRIGFAELAEQALCLPSAQFRIRQTISRAEAEHGLLLSEVMSTDSLAMLKACVATGKFITLMPALPIYSEITEGRLVAVPVESDVLSATRIGVITRAGRRLPPAALALLTMIEAGIRRWTALDGHAIEPPVGQPT